MKKTVIAIIILVVLGGGAYLMTRDNSKTPVATTSSTTSSTNETVADVNNSVVTTRTNSASIKFLADTKGMTLYTYDNDTTGVSNCSGSCLSNWPAYTDPGTLTSLPTDFSSILRTDNGAKQFAYKGKPLYYFVTDTAAGQVTGENVEGFSLAKP